MKKTIAILICFLALYTYAQVPTLAVSGRSEGDSGIEEHLNTFIPKDIRVVNEQGDTVFFHDLIDKPTILNLVYYRCPGICSPVMNSLKDVIDKMGLEIGKDYQVLTLSFDHRENTILALKKKDNYLKQLKTPINPEGWKYFTADSINVAKLTSSVGFIFKRAGEDYIHPGTLIVFSPEGKLTRYFYGTYFLPFEVKLALAEASKGQAGPTINRVLQFCYTYDPQGRQYVLNVTKISGSIIIFLSLVLGGILLYLSKKRKSTIKPE